MVVVEIVAGISFRAALQSQDFMMAGALDRKAVRFASSPAFLPQIPRLALRTAQVNSRRAAIVFLTGAGSVPLLGSRELATTKN